jgi:hypothetical protein
MRASNMKKLVLFLLLFLTAHGAAAQFTNACQWTAAEQKCPLRSGVFSYVQPAGSHLVLENSSGQPLQINEIKASAPGAQPVLSEFCAFLDTFEIRQTQPGKGEVGCVHKLPKEDYPILRWAAGSSSTALAVLPGSRLVIHFNNDLTTAQHTYTVSVSPQKSGIISYRSPRTDEINLCNGKEQSTSWEPWKNSSERPLALIGATVYANANGVEKKTAVQAACLYILDVRGNVRWSNCKGVEKRGTVNFPAQQVLPGEFLVGQAVHKCERGEAWDWAGYLHVQYR